MKRFLSSPDGLPSKKQKSSFFGDTSQDADSSVASSSRPKETREVSSPFYPGRTMYGGAGAYRSFKYLNEPYKRKTPIVKPISKADETEGMSQTAKRILEILQQYPSPLKEAKQLAPFMETRKSFSGESQFPSFSGNSSFLSNSTIGPKSNYNSPQALRGPSVSSLIRMHRDRASQGKPSTPEPKTSPVARQIAASQSSSRCLLPKLAARSQANDNYTSKIRNSLTRRPDKNGSTEHDILPPIKLPTAVLSISSSNLPDFSLSSSKGTQPLSSFSKVKEFKKDMLQSKETNGFAFSSPLGVVEKSKKFQHDNNFIFRKPINVDSSSDILLAEDSEDSSSSKEASEVIICSKVQDVTKPSSTGNLSTNSFANTWGNSFKSTGNWQCPDCWSSNKKEDLKCLACGASNSTTSLNTEKASIDQSQKVPDKLPSSNPLLAHNEKSGDWKCKECWIVNKIDVKTCIACGTNAPGATGTVVDNTKVTTDNGFSQLLKQQQSQWECSSCLSRNEQARMKCACCEAPKPGTCNITKEMNLEIQPTSTFKFGIDQTDSKKSMSMSSSLDKNSTSEKDNSIAPSTGFSFGIVSKDKPEVSSSFSFGVPANEEKKTEQAFKLDSQPGFKLDTQPATKPSGGAFTFCVPAPATPSSDAKAEQTLPKLNALPQASGAFVFEVPTKADTQKSQVADKDKNVVDVKETSTTIPSFGINTLKAQDKPKDVEKPVEVKPITAAPSFSFQVPQPTEKQLNSTSDVNKTATAIIAPSFNFGAPKTIQPIVTVANMPATTVASLANSGLFGSNISGINPISAFSSIQKSSPVTTSPPTNLFGSIAAPAVTTSALGLSTPLEENKSETLKDLTTTSTAPLFSFGSSAAAPKPVGGFNFSFGAGNTPVSKSEASPAFGSPSLLSPANSLFGNTKPSEATNDNSGLVLGGANKSSGLFGASQPTANLFGTNNTIPQATATSPAFGSQTPAFSTGSSTVQLFGNSSVTSPTPPSNMFGLPNQAVSTPAPTAHLFGTASPAAPSFGSPAVTPTPALQFGNSMAQNVVSPTFGSAPTSTFGNLATSTPAPAPAFNFGSSAASSPVFGFGQPQQSQPAAAGVYSFGAGPSPAAPLQSGPGLQFNMGTFSTPTQANSAGQPRRRIAKAVRRTTPR